MTQLKPADFENKVRQEQLTFTVVAVAIIQSLYHGVKQSHEYRRNPCGVGVHSTRSNDKTFETNVVSNLVFLRPVDLCDYIRAKHTLLSCSKCVHAKTDIREKERDFKKILKSWLRHTHQKGSANLNPSKNISFFQTVKNLFY